MIQISFFINLYTKNNMIIPTHCCGTEYKWVFSEIENKYETESKTE